jgi:mannose-1-phosphate guanylyltransferase
MITSVVLSGGSGINLCPLSRQLHLKQAHLIQTLPFLLKVQTASVPGEINIVLFDELCAREGK